MVGGAGRTSCKWRWTTIQCHGVQFRQSHFPAQFALALQLPFAMLVLHLALRLQLVQMEQQPSRCRGLQRIRQRRSIYSGDESIAYHQQGEVRERRYSLLLNRHGPLPPTPRPPDSPDPDDAEYTLSVSPVRSSPHLHDPGKVP